MNQIDEKIEELEKITGKTLGDKKNPLLVSVRSGARASMPGMMDTILNLGMNDDVAEGFSEVTNNKRFVMILIVVLFRCLLMLLWNFQSLLLKESLMQLKKKRVLN